MPRFTRTHRDPKYKFDLNQVRNKGVIFSAQMHIFLYSCVNEYIILSIMDPDDELLTGPIVYFQKAWELIKGIP